MLWFVGAKRQLEKYRINLLNKMVKELVTSSVRKRFKTATESEEQSEEVK